MRFVRASLGTRQLTHQHNLGAQGRSGAGAASCWGLPCGPSLLRSWQVCAPLTTGQWGAGREWCGQGWARLLFLSSWPHMDPLRDPGQVLKLPCTPGNEQLCWVASSG